MSKRRKNNLLTAAAPKLPDVLHFTAPVEFTAGQAAAGDKPAKLPTFNIHAYSGDPMSLEGSFYPVIVDLAGAKLAKVTTPIFLNHEPSQVVGHSEKGTVTKDGIDLSGIVSGTGDAAREVVSNSANGFPYEASIGFRINRREFLEAGKPAKVNTRQVTGPLNIARDCTIREVSFVPIGADASTSATITANQAKGPVMDPKFKAWLEAKSIDPDSLTDPVKGTLEAAYKSELTATGAAGAGNTDLDTVLAAAKKRDETKQKIVDMTAKALTDYPGQTAVIDAMSRQAMEGSWDPNRYELELLRATRPQVNARGRTRDDEGLTGQVVEAALCLAGGIEYPEKKFSEQVLEAASKRWRYGLGLGELFMLFARRNGHEALGTRDIKPMLQAAFAESDDRMLKASGVSTLSLPLILANVANRFLKMGFDAVESTWRSIAAIRSVKDFKQVASYTLTGDFEYTEVPPGGDIEHATAGEETYTNQAKTYGRMFAIDRRDIINDDLGALTQVPRKLGRGGALKVNGVFWPIFMDNASFFTSGHNNYKTGATPGPTDTRLNIDGLTLAELTFFAQTDPNGKPLGAMPKYLVVPNALVAAASVLMKSAEIRDTTASTKYPTANPHAGKFEVVRSSYLSNAAYTGYSAAAWYLLADPQDMAVIEVAFLNGVETPTVETADADFSQLGVQMRGYHDFGVALQEYRGGVKMKGEA